MLHACTHIKSNMGEEVWHACTHIKSSMGEEVRHACTHIKSSMSEEVRHACTHIKSSMSEEVWHVCTHIKSKHGRGGAACMHPYHVKRWREAAGVHAHVHGVARTCMPTHGVMSVENRPRMCHM